MGSIKGRALALVAGSIVTLLILGVVPAWSQSVSLASIAGQVSDPSGALLPGVDIAVTNTQTGVVRHVTTNAEGLYRANDLIPGTYTIEASLAGFQNMAFEQVTFTTGHVTPLDITMKVGSVKQTVTVSGQAPLLKVENTEIGATLTNEQVAEIPLNSRNYLSLVVLTPGAVQTSNNWNVSFNGAPVYSNNLLMDGVNATRGDMGGFVSGWGQTVTPQISPDMIQEIKIDSANLPTAQGRGSGNTMNVVTKSGTNDFHGDLSYTFRNEALDARNFFAGQRAPFKFNEPGFTIGGPIRRDKTFFFIGDENGRVINGNSTFQPNLPTAAYRQQFPAVYDYYVNRTPLPNVAQYLPDGTVDPDFGTIQVNGNQTIRNDMGQIRIDQYFSSKDSAYFRYQIGDSMIKGPVFSTYNLGSYLPIRIQNMVLSETHIFSPNLVNEARLGFNYVLANNYSAGPPPPVLNVYGLDFFQSVQGGIDSHVGVGTISENLTYIKGRHTIATGFEFTPTKGSRFGYAGSQYDYNDPADFIANTPYDYDESPAQGREACWYSTYAPYAQDQIRLTKRLTFTIGARYEYNSVQHNSRVRNYIWDTANFADSHLTNYGQSWYQANRDVLDPRVGLAYRLTGDGKTILRAAYGKYDVPMVLFGPDVMGNEPRYQGYDYLTTENPTLAFPETGNLVAALTGPPNYFMISPTIKNPYQQDWNLNLQRALPWNMGLEVGYVGTHYVDGYSNVYYLNLPGPNYALPPDPAIGTLGNWQTLLTQHYEGLQISLRKRTAHGLTFDAYYAWSHTIDNGTQEQDAFPNNPNCARCEMGNGAFGVRHNLTADYVYALPFGHGKPLLGNAPRWASGVVSGWQVSGLLEANTGFPYSVGSGTDTYGNTVGWTQRPNWVAGCDPYNVPGGLHYPDRSLNINCFTMPAQGTFGNLGRNTLFGPPVFNLDFALARKVKIRERGTLEFRGEAFNISNTPMFNNPSPALASPSSFEEITSTVGGNGQFGGQRQIELMLKYLF